jgi:hypothetical protein
MSSIRTLPVRLLIFISLLLPLANAQAVEKFREAGIISALTYDSFTVRGVVYRIAPTAKLKSEDASRKRLSDFKPGDRIYFEGQRIGSVFYVEFVVYEIPTPS